MCGRTEFACVCVCFGAFANVKRAECDCLCSSIESYIVRVEQSLSELCGGKSNLHAFSGPQKAWLLATFPFAVTHIHLQTHTRSFRHHINKTSFRLQQIEKIEILTTGHSCVQLEAHHVCYDSSNSKTWAHVLQSNAIRLSMCVFVFVMCLCWRKVACGW